MANKKKTQISVVVDRSGSMTSIASDMKGGFDEFIKEQKDLEGEATVTLARFDDEYEIVHNMIPINEVTPLELIPRGWTALLDGIGKTMNTVRGQIMEMDEDERPAKCIFIIVTDGGENSSKEYNKDQVFQMIEDCNNDEEINYEFVFLGANQDAIAAGGNLGIRKGSSMTYGATGAGARGMMKTLSKNVSSYRSSVDNDAVLCFSEEDRSSAMGDVQSSIKVASSSRSKSRSKKLK